MRGRVSSVIAAVALGACTAQGPTLNAQAEQMELALVSCKAQLGFGGKLKTEVSFDGGVASARALPFDQITDAQASQINACAGGAETLSDGLVVVPMTAMGPAAIAKPAPVEPVAVQPAQASVAATAPVHNGACPPGFFGMYAGTIYCTGDTN
jgi:hypothetical protein